MEKKVILLSNIKNNLFAVAVPKEFIEAAILLAMQYGAKGMMVVHAGTHELIAGADEFEAAQARGDEKVEVLLWNIPKELVFGAKLLKNAQALSYQEGSKLAKEAMTYFSFKKNGAGTALRKMLDPDDQGLADFVAGLFGTNRTTLYSWLKVAEAKPELLKFVDKGTVTMEAAERVVNQRSPKVVCDSDTAEDTDKEDTKPVKKRWFVKHDAINHTQQCTAAELSVTTKALPSILASLGVSQTIPNDVLIERVYQHAPKKNTKNGEEEPSPKVDHLSIAVQGPNFAAQISVQIFDNGGNSGAVIQLPVNSPDIDEEDEELAMAA